MSVRGRAVLLVSLAFSVGTSVAATAHPDADGVRAAENRWSEAFMTGDATTLDALLDPDYVSVGTAGQPRAKAEILQLSRDFAKAHPDQHARPLPSTSTIRVIGNAAVVQHHGDQDTSVDVFYFRDGRWRAWYSQHTALGR